jgi:SAM-dependent methyltransferase
MHNLNALHRRLKDSRYANIWLSGQGLDISDASDPLSSYTSSFPKISALDLLDQAATHPEYLDNIPNDTYDFVHSAFQLQYFEQPFVAVRNWLRVIKPGGFLIIKVPDEDLWYQGVWPPTVDPAAKFSFSLYKSKSWNVQYSINSYSFFTQNAIYIDVLKGDRLDENYNYATPNIDQISNSCECGVEFVLRRRTDIEKGRMGYYA